MFDVGDLVVCVDAGTAGQSGLVATELKTGQHYRVAEVYEYNDGPGVNLDGVFTERGRGFYAWRFRKVDAPDTEVSRLIRACKPVREGQPA